MTDEVLFRETILSSLKSDEIFLRYPRKTQAVIERYVRKMPEVLENRRMLDLPVTYPTLNHTRNEFWCWCVDTSYIREIVELTPEAELQGMSHEEFALTTRHKILTTIQQSTRMSHGLSQLWQAGTSVVTDEELMLSPSTGLNIYARSLYVTKRLTVRRLLEVQPLLIFRYD